MEPDRHDYSREVHLESSRLARGLLWLAGTIAVGLAVLGVILPLLPTTPFLLLAAACYARASVRFYNWLLNHRLFGSTIRAWRFHGGIPRRPRRVATLLIVLVFASSMWAVAPRWYLQAMLAVIGSGLLVFLWRLPVVELDALGAPHGGTPVVDAEPGDGGEPAEASAPASAESAGGGRGA